MNFTQIFDRATEFWPDEIDISDGKLLENESGSFENLRVIWDGAEKMAESEGELLDLMTWAIFCGFHKKAIHEFEKGNMMIKLKDIDLKYVQLKFEESLFSEEYADSGLWGIYIK